MVKILLLLCLSVAKGGTAQLIYSPFSAPYTGTGTYSRHFTDVFSVACNQAALSQVTIPVAGLYMEKRFMLKELNVFQAVMAAPFAAGGAAITIRYSGFAGYNESELGMAYGRKLGEAVDLGIQFNYTRLQITGYGSASGMNVEMGTILHFTEQLHGGFHIRQPAGKKFSKNNYDQPLAVYTAGLGYEASDKLFLGMEVGKAENQPVDVYTAVHYAFIKQFFVRAGIATSTGSFFTGFGLLWKQCRADLAATYHPRLGLTPSLLLVFNGKNTAPDE